MNRKDSERLRKVIRGMSIEADRVQEWSKQHTDHHQYNLIGISTGYRNAIRFLEMEFGEEIIGETLKERLEGIMSDVEDVASEKIRAGFPELFSGNEDGPIEPFVFIDNNKTLFRDSTGRYFFWDETYSNWYGPFNDSVDACLHMRRYTDSL